MESTSVLDGAYLQILTTAEIAFSVGLMFFSSLDSGVSIDFTNKGMDSERKLFYNI